jgi:hypothetical protein
MKGKIGNSMEPIVSKAIERVLESYPEHPYKKVFAQPNLRRMLMVNVLRQLPIKPMAIEEEPELSSELSNLSLSQEQELSIQTVIRQEIAYLIQPKSDCISRSAPEEVESCFAPSHWFG